MIRTGRSQDLIVLRTSSEGLVLGDDDNIEVILPSNECPPNAEDGSTVNVFIYRDLGNHLIATTKKPKVQAGGFALLQMKATRGSGAIMDWAMPVDLLIPHEEQKKEMDEGRWYVTYVGLDTETDRLFGSTRIENYLDNRELTVQNGDRVDLLVFGRSDLGVSVIVNDRHQGLVHVSDIFKPVSIGDRITGYIKTVRDDNKLDVVLQPIGYRQYIDAHTAMLAKRLQNRGYISLTDKSSAEDIHAEFGISKKAFKKALGALYKDRVVRLEETGVVWIGDR